MNKIVKRSKMVKMKLKIVKIVKIVKMEFCGGLEPRSN